MVEFFSDDIVFNVCQEAISQFVTSPTTPNYGGRQGRLHNCCGLLIYRVFLHELFRGVRSDDLVDWHPPSFRNFSQTSCMRMG
jgi:hypothetical protein